MVSKETSSEVLEKLLQLPANTLCFDCDRPGIEWASVSHGVFLCTDCAEIHRGLGVNVSFIRSLSLDEWSFMQLKMMTAGGNPALKQFFGQYGLLDQPIRYKYRTRAAQYYRRMILMISEGNLFSGEQPQVEWGAELTGNSFVREEQGFSVKGLFNTAMTKSREYRNKMRDSLQSDESPTFLGKVGGGITAAMDKTKEKTSQAYDYMTDQFVKVNNHPKVKELSQDISNTFSKANDAIVTQFKKLKREPGETTGLNP